MNKAIAIVVLISAIASTASGGFFDVFSSRNNPYAEEPQPQQMPPQVMQQPQMQYLPQQQQMEEEAQYSRRGGFFGSMMDMYSQPEPAAADVYYPPQDPAARAPPSPAEEPQSYASKLTGLLGGMMSMSLGQPTDADIYLASKDGMPPQEQQPKSFTSRITGYLSGLLNKLMTKVIRMGSQQFGEFLIGAAGMDKNDPTKPGTPALKEVERLSLEGSQTLRNGVPGMK